MKLYTGPFFLKPFVFFVTTQIFIILMPLLVNLDQYKSNDKYFFAVFTLVVSIVIVYFSKIITIKSYERKVSSTSYTVSVKNLYFISRCYFLVSPILILLHIYIAGSFPFLDSVRGAGFIELANARELYIKKINPIFQLIVYINEQLIPMFIIVIALIDWKTSGLIKSKRYGILAFVYLFIASIFGIAKFPPILAVILVVITLLLIKKQSYKTYAAIAALIFVLLGLTGLLVRGGEGDASDFLLIIQDLIFRRIYTLNAEVFYSYFEIFPDKIDYLYGKGIRLFSMLSGDADFQLANLVYSQMYPDGLDSGWANTGYLGQLWADFSYFGIFFGSVFIGCIIGVGETLVIDRREAVGPYAIYLHVFLLFYLAYLSISSMFSTNLMLAWVFTLLLKRIFFKKQSVRLP